MRGGWPTAVHRRETCSGGDAAGGGRWRRGALRAWWLGKAAPGTVSAHGSEGGGCRYVYTTHVDGMLDREADYAYISIDRQIPQGGRWQPTRWLGKAAPGTASAHGSEAVYIYIYLQIDR